MESIGDRLARYLKEKDWTQQQLAAAAKMTRAAISLIVTGDSKRPNAENLLKIAAALGKSPYDLIFGETESVKYPAVSRNAAAPGWINEPAAKYHSANEDIAIPIELDPLIRDMIQAWNSTTVSPAAVRAWHQMIRSTAQMGDLPPPPKEKPSGITSNISKLLPRNNQSDIDSLANDEDFDALYLRSQSDNDEDARYKLGLKFLRVKDHLAAARNFLIAAQRGHAGAEYMYGKMHYIGLGVPGGRNPSIAAEWIRKAAESGLSAAQSQLGFIYATGLGVKPNDDESLRWFKKAADQGDERAMAYLHNRDNASKARSLLAQLFGSHETESDADSASTAEPNLEKAKKHH